MYSRRLQPARTAITDVVRVGDSGDTGDMCGTARRTATYVSRIQSVHSELRTACTGRGTASRRTPQVSGLGPARVWGTAEELRDVHAVRVHARVKKRYSTFVLLLDMHPTAATFAASTHLHAACSSPSTPRIQVTAPIPNKSLMATSPPQTTSRSRRRVRARHCAGSAQSAPAPGERGRHRGRGGRGAAARFAARAWRRPHSRPQPRPAGRARRPRVVPLRAPARRATRRRSEGRRLPRAARRGR